VTDLQTRLLRSEELPRLWEIDRREFIESIYRLQDGQLVLEPHHFDVPGWPPGNQEGELPRLVQALGRGGKAWAVFDGEMVVAGTVVDTQWVGVNRDLVQFEWLHVSRDYRRRGLARALFERASEFALQLGAKGMYVSATPSQNTLNFYQRRGCVLVEPDPELFEREPEDIHLEWRA
jgi:GNAT superfamily N-acetyltransferase